jgi:hypothetical protein
MRNVVIFAIFLRYMCCPVFADDIQTCGDQGTDNRPNWCARPDGTGGLVQGKSECRKVSDTQFEYTHCSGSKKTYTGSSQCCAQSSQCPGAFYVAECVN